MQVLIQLMLRFVFGMCAAMAMTSPKLVTGGFFRVHLWVAMGGATVAVLASFAGVSREASGELQVAAAGNLSIALAVGCYFASVAWLYGASRLGRVLLAILSAVALLAALIATPGLVTGAERVAPSAATLGILDAAMGGLVLGSTLVAMLLGHWYLNTPTMKLDPLRRLIALIFVAVAARAVTSGIGAAWQWELVTSASTVPFISLRWLTGILGVAVTAYMALQTLRIPNTQSATGILYVTVIFSLIGELCSQLLSAEAAFPL